MSAFRVRGPKTPSTSPTSKPFSFNTFCACRTWSPPRFSAPPAAVPLACSFGPGLLFLLTRLSLHWLELVLLRLPWGGILGAGLSRTLAWGARAIFVAGPVRADGGPLMGVLGVAIPVLGRSPCSCWPSLLCCSFSSTGTVWLECCCTSPGLALFDRLFCSALLRLRGLILLSL
jgi:hypothetical protein